MKYSKVRAYKYKLEEPEITQTKIIGTEFDTRYMSMLDDGTFLEKYGYTWDGSSIPHKKKIRALSFLNPLVWVRIKDAYDADRYCKTASLVHDGLSQAMREGWLDKAWKQEADLLYETMCFEDRMEVWELKTKTKNKTPKKRIKYENKVYRWAKKRYWALRKFGNVGIEPEKNPRNKIYEV